MIHTADIRMTSGTWEGKGGGGKYDQMMENARLNKNGERTEPVGGKQEQVVIGGIVKTRKEN
jgi:hypothetical protein